MVQHFAGGLEAIVIDSFCRIDGRFQRKYSSCEKSFAGCTFLYICALIRELHDAPLPVLRRRPTMVRSDLRSTHSRCSTRPTHVVVFVSRLDYMKTLSITTVRCRRAHRRGLGVGVRSVVGNLIPASAPAGPAEDRHLTIVTVGTPSDHT